MKKQVYIFCLIIAVTGISFPAFAQPQHIGVFVPWDTSDSCRSFGDEFVTLFRQIVTSLQDDDYIEVLTAHPSSVRLKIAQYVKTRQDLNSLVSSVRDISYPIFSDADRSLACSTAFAHAAEFLKRNSGYSAIIIMMSDGKYSDTEARTIEYLVGQHKNLSTRLYVLGGGQTARPILFASNQDKYHFSLITEATPASWIKEMRPPQIAKIPTVADTNQMPNIIKSNKSGTSSSPAPAAGNTTPNAAPFKQDKSPEQANNDHMKVYLWGPFDLSASKTTLKQDTTSRHAPDSNMLATSATTATTVTSKEPAKKPHLPANPPQDESKTTKEPNKPIPAGAAIKTSKQPSVKQMGPHSWIEDVFARMRAHWLKWALYIAAVIAILLIVVFFIASLLLSSKQKQAFKKQSSDKVQPPPTLIAKYNGQTYRLGPIHLLRTTYIGSKLGSTIKISDPSMLPHHVCLYVKRGQLYIQNLAKKPIKVNSLELAGGKKTVLLPPTVLQLSDTIKITFETEKLAALPQLQKEG